MPRWKERKGANGYESESNQCCGIFDADWTDYCAFAGGPGGLPLCVCSLVLSVVSQILAVIPVLGWLLLIVVQILYLVLLVLTIVGIINAAQDVEKPLPIVGGIQLLR